MKLYILTYCLFIFTSQLFPQEFIFQNRIGDFENATSFYITPTGMLYVTDDFTDEVYQLDTLGNILNLIGGYGWEINAFDDPVDVFADPLKVYVTDKNNHRIQRFDKNLNFIFEIDKHESDIEVERFGYPVSAVQSNQGDIIILDSENTKVLKFNLFGDFIQTIGGYDYGNFTLVNPKKLAVSMQNEVYVLDEEGIFIYDNYGTAIGKIETPEEIISIRIIFEWLSINNKQKIYLINLNSKDKKLIELTLKGIEDNSDFVSSMFFNSRLYILTSKNILIYSAK